MQNIPIQEANEGDESLGELKTPISSKVQKWEKSQKSTKSVRNPRVHQKVKVPLLEQIPSFIVFWLLCDVNMMLLHSSTISAHLPKPKYRLSYIIYTNYYYAGCTPS